MRDIHANNFFPLPVEFSTDYDRKHYILYGFHVIKVKEEDKSYVFVSLQ